MGGASSGSFTVSALAGVRTHEPPGVRSNSLRVNRIWIFLHEYFISLGNVVWFFFSSSVFLHLPYFAFPSFPFISSLSFNFYLLPSSSFPSLSSLSYPSPSFLFFSFILPSFSLPQVPREASTHKEGHWVTRRALEVRSRPRGHTRHVSKAHRLKRSQGTGGARRGTHLHPPDAEGWLRRIWPGTEPLRRGVESENCCQIIVRRITSARCIHSRRTEKLSYPHR